MISIFVGHHKHSLITHNLISCLDVSCSDSGFTMRCTIGIFGSTKQAICAIQSYKFYEYCLTMIGGTSSGNLLQTSMTMLLAKTDPFTHLSNFLIHSGKITPSAFPVFVRLFQRLITDKPQFNR